MSSDTSVPPPAIPAPEDLSVARADDAAIELKAVEPANTNGVDAGSNVNIESEVTASKDSESVPPLPSSTPVADSVENETHNTNNESEMARVTPPATAAEGSADSAAPKSSKSRRKSAGVPEHKSKKLSKKASMAKLTHTDALPGEHYFIKLKGYPLWPGIICDEVMLPQTLLKSRPVTAAKPDGTYRVDFADGGKNVQNRTFPVMYLHTNEFGWIPNRDLQDLSPDTVLDGLDEKKVSRDLYQAYQRASENHDLDYYKQVLSDFQESRQAEAEAKALAKAEKAASKTKRKSKAAVDADEEDVEMADVSAEVDADDTEKPKSSKKRKAVAEVDDSAETPKRTDSVKKLKLKATASSTPKANGTTPKSTKKETVTKAKAKPKKTEVPEAEKEPELSPEEKRVKKEKEILFLRHKLQKGLLTKEQQPKEEEMKQMSEFISKLEGYADLEVSIIRATKINKVLKAILKLEEIPKEADFRFKERSQDLLGKWNKILESETPTTAVSSEAVKEASGETNGAPATPEEEQSEKTKAADSKVEKDAPQSASTSAVPETVEKESKAEGAVEPETEVKQGEEVRSDEGIEATS